MPSRRRYTVLVERGERGRYYYFTIKHGMDALASTADKAAKHSTLLSIGCNAPRGEGFGQIAPSACQIARSLKTTMPKEAGNVAALAPILVPHGRGA